MKSWVKALATVAIATATAFSAMAEGVSQINFGILSVESQQNLMKRWGPILEDLEKQTGIPVKPRFASDYAGIIEGMRFNKVDVVLYGNKSAIEAVDRAGAEVFAQITEVTGAKGYYSILVAHKSNDKINSLDDVLKCDKSLDFGIGDPNSTSGFLVPTTFIFAANGVEPRNCFKTVRNASHETNLLSVANEQVDVATANNRAMYLRLKKNAPAQFAKLKEVWRSPLIPSDPLAWRKNLPHDVKAKIYHFFLTYGRLGDPEKVRRERKILANANFGPFTPSSDAQLYPVREMAYNKEINRVKANNNLSAGEKQTRIASFEQKIKEVRALHEELPKK